jgi:hypothetical protein
MLDHLRGRVKCGGLTRVNRAHGTKAGNIFCYTCIHAHLNSSVHVYSKCLPFNLHHKGLDLTTRTLQPIARFVPHQTRKRLTLITRKQSQRDYYPTQYLYQESLAVRLTAWRCSCTFVTASGLWLRRSSSCSPSSRQTSMPLPPYFRYYTKPRHLVLTTK